MELEVKTKREIIVLVGAGASVGLGYPTITNLSAREALQALPVNRRPSVPYLWQVADNIDLYLRAYPDATGLEEVISRTKLYRENLRQMVQDPNLQSCFLAGVVGRATAQRLFDATSTLEWLFYEALFRIYRRQDLIGKQLLVRDRLARLYADLATENGGQLRVYTTNYDMAFEMLSTSGQFLLSEEGAFANSEYIPASKSTQDKAHVSCPTVTLRRLHGCVERGRKCESGELYDFDATGPSPSWPEMLVKIGRRGPELTSEPFNNAYRYFRNDVERAGHVWIVLGYSFRDEAIASCLYSSLCNTDGTALVIVDKNLAASDVCQRLCILPGHDPNKIDIKCLHEVRAPLEDESTLDSLRHCLVSMGVCKTTLEDRHESQ